MSERVDSIESVAGEMLKCALAWEPGARLIGNVRAEDIARVCIAAIATCPKCGSAAWVNIDCDLCRLCDAVGNPR